MVCRQPAPYERIGIDDHVTLAWRRWVVQAGGYRGELELEVNMVLQEVLRLRLDEEPLVLVARVEWSQEDAHVYRDGRSLQHHVTCFDGR